MVLVFPDDSSAQPTLSTCSSKGCTSEATWALLWNNPKLHTEDRRKTWLACDRHRETLGDFLRARGFLRTVERFDRPGTDRPEGPTGAG